MKEEWRPVVGWEIYYEVSNLGRVRSLPRVTKRSDGVMRKGSGRVLKSIPVAKDGSYLGVSLFGGGRRRTRTVHRLVAKAFLDNPESKRCVNHKDSNRQNNRLDNLDWMTHKENTAHAVAAGRMVYPIQVRYSMKTIKKMFLDMVGEDESQGDVHFDDGLTDLAYKIRNKFRAELRSKLEQL